MSCRRAKTAPRAVPPLFSPARVGPTWDMVEGHHQKEGNPELFEDETHTEIRTSDETGQEWQRNINDRCDICLETIEDNDVQDAGNCRHYFHKECVETMVKCGDMRCPLCRQPFSDSTIEECFPTPDEPHLPEWEKQLQYGNWDHLSQLIDGNNEAIQQLSSDGQNTLLTSLIRYLHDCRFYEGEDCEIFLKLIRQVLDRDDVEIDRVVAGQTALRVAFYLERTDVMKMLLEKGVDIEQPVSNLGETLLHWFVGNNDLEMASFLLEKGANIEARDKEYKTPLLAACEEGFLEMVSFLLEKRANIEARDHDQMTPLLMACEQGGVDMVKLLLDKGANVNAQNVNGATALHMAVERDLPDVLEVVLTRNDIDFDIRDQLGKTALEWCADDKKSRLADLIQEKKATRSSDPKVVY